MLTWFSLLLFFVFAYFVSKCFPPGPLFFCVRAHYGRNCRILSKIQYSSPLQPCYVIFAATYAILNWVRKNLSQEISCFFLLLILVKILLRATLLCVRDPKQESLKFIHTFLTLVYKTWCWLMTRFYFCWNWILYLYIFGALVYQNGIRGGNSQNLEVCVDSRTYVL